MERRGASFTAFAVLMEHDELKRKFIGMSAHGLTIGHVMPGRAGRSTSDQVDTRIRQANH